MIRIFARLRWQVLRGAFRHGGAQRVAVAVGIMGAAVAGAVGGALLAGFARAAADPEPILIVAPVAITMAIIALGVITGVTQPIDPRVIVAEPLTDRQLALGLLTASAAGPPGIAAGLLGLGLFVGAVDGFGSVPVVVVGCLALLATLSLVGRTTVNLLGLLTVRFPRIGQSLVGVVSLAFYGSFQLLPAAFGNLDDAGRTDVADVVRFSPPGQIGVALAGAGSSPLAALGHLAVGALWLPLLGWVFMVTTRRFAVAVGSASSSRTVGEVAPGGLRGLARRSCGTGPVGVIAWRSVRTRLRHPRQALETFIGAGIGLAIILVPALTSDAPGAAAVLVGGAVQLAVLFMAGNSIGSDGPALGAEILCGLEPETIIAGKVRGVLVVASPLIVVGPLIGAALTGEWAYLPAGFAVGAGGLLAGIGGAIVQSTYVPIAVPESDNPLAGGESGSGLLAAVVLVAIVLVLAIVTLPFALGLVWALSRDSLPLVSLFSLVTVGGGWLVMYGGRRLAGRRWRTNEAEIYDAIIPAH